jgi:diguanylate cyclase (GGDEF)-like protein
MASLSLSDAPCDRILIVDDDDDALSLLRMVLQREGYAVETAHGGLEALAIADERQFAVVLSDLSMASGDGFTLVAQLRKRGLHDGPVILMSGEDQVDRRVRGFDLGADDFLPKPVQVPELLARLRAHLRRAKRHDELKCSSVQDSLTRLLNRQGIGDRFDNYAALLRRRPGTLSLLLIDVDDFKDVNDVYGHAAGDRMLLEIGRTLVSCVRASDSVGRWGGDEFVILAPEADAETARTLCERIRTLWPVKIPVGASEETAVALSIGAATWHVNEPLEALIARADAAMYVEKRRRKTPVDVAPRRSWFGLARGGAVGR